MTPASHPSPITSGLLLAAGLNSRLRSEVGDLPKGLIEFDGESIVGRSLRLLEEAGISDIVVVVGWAEEAYRAFLGHAFPSARIVVNPDYASTGSLRSLALGARAVKGDTLLVESDVIFEPRGLTEIIRSPTRDAILVSGPTKGGDEVWVHGREGILEHLGKEPWSGAPLIGELVGLSRVSSGVLRALVDASGSLPAHAHYEDGLNAVCPTRPISVLKIPDLAWCEIDDRTHLERARESVWPRIRRADGLAR
jgi:2-aminoethylphosphonate-pyruvate transaminase